MRQVSLLRGLAVATLLCAAALAAPLPSLGQDAPAEPKAEEEEVILVGLEWFECESPPFRLERPSDSWQFLNLELLRERARAARQDTGGYETLKARLWQGASRANIFVHARPDTVNRATPPTAAELGQPEAQGLVRALVEGKLEQEGGVRVGPREGYMFEVHGKPRDARPDAPPVAVVRALVYRNEDHHLFFFTLEAPVSERLSNLKRDFAKVLKKARL